MKIWFGNPPVTERLPYMPAGSPIVIPAGSPIVIPVGSPIVIPAKAGIQSLREASCPIIPGFPPSRE